MRLRLGLACLSVVAAVLGLGGVVAGAVRTPTTDLRVVFSAKDRSTGRWGIYTTDTGTEEVARITPDDGAVYNWPTWAFNGTRVIYTARYGPAGAPEEIYLMNTDGSGARKLTETGWRNAQPMVSADGRSVIFTSAWPEFKIVALYSLDLASLQVTNLTAAGAPFGASDSDPRWAPDGSYTYARSFDDDARGMPTQIWAAGPDGVANRRPLVADHFSNVDPSVSPDARQVTFGSYRGGGPPHRDLSEQGLLDLIVGGGDPRGLVKIGGWQLVTQELATGEQRVLTQGLECDRPATDPCRPEEGAAFVPRWTPDGAAVGYVSARARDTVCICVVGRDGGSGRPVVESTALDIDWFDWFDWRQPRAAAPDSLDHIGSSLPADRLLFVGREGTEGLSVSEPDRFGSQPLPLPAGLVPLTASWSPDRGMVAFSARLPFDESRSSPTPPPPAGAHRSEHFTLDILKGQLAASSGSIAAEEQIFLLDIQTGAARQVTTPWTEDYMDGAHADDPRSNTDPSFSPDGRSVLFTNRSTKTQESFLLKLDLTTGEVYSLTNATAGAMPVFDSGGRFSPDGRQVAFATGRGDGSLIAVMDADGRNVRTLVEDGLPNATPAWSPDGRFLVYAGHLGAEVPGDGVASTGWRLVRLELATGQQLELTPGDTASALRPVWSPDGSRIAFISTGRSGQPDLHVVPAGGGPHRPIQITQLTHEVSVDWR